MNSTTPRRRFHYRALTSYVAAVSFLLLAAGGAVLYVTPQGRVAHWIDWRFLGLDKDQWGSVHITLGLLFAIAAVVHLWFNWRVFWSYLTRRVAAGRRLWREMLVALVLCAAVVAGTLREVPPFEQVIALNTSIKADWDAATRDLPYAHAEDSTLGEFADRTGLAREELVATLRQAGFAVSDVGTSVGALAAANHVSPSALFQVIREQHPQVGRQRRGRPGRGRGAGRYQS